MPLGAVVPDSDLPKLGAVVPDHDIPDPSVMDPNKGVDTLKRIGRAVTDPKTMIPLAAGAASAALPLVAPEASLATKLGLAVAGGFAAPYAEAGASKAMGGNPGMPSIWEAVRSAGMNLGFEGAGSKAPKIIEGAEATAKLPKAEQTLGQLTQQMRNTDFLKAQGFNDQQIAEIAKDPEGAAIRFKQSIAQGNRVADTFKQTVANERTAFQGRYSSALGDRATASVDPKPIAAQMRQLAGGAGQHELTSTFKNFLLRKADEIDPPAAPPKVGRMTVDVGDLGKVDVNDPKNAAMIANYASHLDPANPKEGKILQQLQALGVDTKPKAGSFTTQDARSLNTELHENYPGQATNLDKQAITQLDQGIRNEYHKGWTQEQVGQEEGIDKDYAMFQKTIGQLKPNQANFGEQTADAFFQTAKQNPTLALNFVRMADDAGKLPEFRDAFMTQLAQEMKGAGGGPINQMKVLQKLQTEWRSTEDGKAILGAVFGKDSPMANPVELSKYLGASNQPATQDALTRAGRTMGNVGYYARNAVFLGVLGGSFYRLQQHPEEWPLALGALATLAVSGPLITRMSAGGQRAMIRMLATPNPETVKTFFRVAGPALTAGISQPSEMPTETSRP